MIKRTNCDICGRFINADKADMDVTSNGKIRLFCKKCSKRRCNRG